MPTKSNNTGGRGGARPGAGRKKSAVKEKAETHNFVLILMFLFYLPANYDR